MHTRSAFLLVMATLPVAPALAETAPDFMGRFEAEARTGAPGFAASASRGEKFFRTPGSKDWRCTSCHTSNPTQPGQHASTGKTIAPLAPAANSERFVRADKVD